MKKEKKIIGRGEELQVLNEIRKSKEAEFLAVYGRRRVGKTYLIREAFSRSEVYFEITGLKGAPLAKQLKNFQTALNKSFPKYPPFALAPSWMEAFEELTKIMKYVSKKKKVVVFLDELPWLASKKSGLMEALDHYWNTRWVHINHLILIVCGSAASWMLDRFVHAKGGLYNRITKRMLLEPFNLRETQEFLKSRSVCLGSKQVLDLYMVLGGIPFYLREVKKGKSPMQTVEELCFKKSGLLHTEFKNLFHALFDQAELNLKICREIVKNGNSISRNDLIKAIKGTSGGALNRRLYELEASGFIKCFIPYGKQKRGKSFRLVDEYTLFYLKWLEPLLASGTYSGKEAYWSKHFSTPKRCTWAGFAFEGVCIKHIYQVAVALGLENVPFMSGTWNFKPPRGSKQIGAQIDLLFDREDGVITICEIKYGDTLFSLEKGYAKELARKMECFQEKTKSLKEVDLALITVKGLKRNLWSEDLVGQEVTLEDLYIV